MGQPFRAYADRNRRLRKDGYRDYGDYLKSPEWLALRTRVLKHFDFKCFRCGGRASCIHHADYDGGTMKGVRTGSLIPLCKACRDFAEMDGDRKCSLEEANRRIGLDARRKCETCGQMRPWAQFRYADDKTCSPCWRGRDVPAGKPRGRLHRQKSFPLVGGPHHGERFKPQRDGKGLPTLLSRTCETAGGFGVCRSTYTYDPQRRSYVFSSQHVE